MIKLIFDGLQWRCENCKKPISFPGIIPSLEMLEEREWKYCPYCRRKIDFKATKKERPDGIR